MKHCSVSTHKNVFKYYNYNHKNLLNGIITVMVINAIFRLITSLCEKNLSRFYCFVVFSD